MKPSLNVWFRFCMMFAMTGCMMAASAPGQEKMPREDVIDVPAIGTGLCLSNVFQTNMVLQRDKPLSIWGWADAGKRITVKFAGRTQSSTAGEDRSWRVTFPAMDACSDAQVLSVSTVEESLTLENILIGDVWVLGGQSNMEFPLSRVENGQLEIVSANFPNMRILTVPAANGPDARSGFPRLHEWSGWFGRHFRKGDWDVCSPSIVRELSAIGYVFGRRVHMASQIPIGIVDVSRGGTTVETWTPDSVLRNMRSQEVQDLLTEWDKKVSSWNPQSDLEERVKRFHQKVARFEKEGRKIPANEVEPTDLRPGPAMDQNRPGNCYASMISPIRGLSVKGVIFHQGYNNCFNGTRGAIMYRDIFPEMIASWRTAFGDPKLPFGIISLCTEGPTQTLENYSEMMANPGPYIREAQYQTFLQLFRTGDSNIGFTSSYDLRRRWYHPQLKIPAGERMARWALSTQYGFQREIRWKPPMVSEMTLQDGQVLLQFDEPVSGVDDGSPIVGFAIAGDDRKFHPADAQHRVVGKDNRGRPQIDRKTLVLSSPLVSQPTQYRYAWGRSPLGNLQAHGNTDIPVATQRSDQWPLEAVPLNALGQDVVTKLNRGQQRKLRETLRQQDLDRRTYNAGKLKIDSEDE